jgi:hypothetical protein
MRFNIDFTNETLFDYDDFYITHTGTSFTLKDLGSGTYTTASPVIEYLSQLFASAITGFRTTSTGDVTFYVVLDGIPYYYDGAAWSESDGILAESNTEAEIIDELSTLPEFTSFSIGVLLNSDGATVATISEIDIEYTPVALDTAVETAKVYFQVRDFSNVQSDISIAISCNKRGFVPYKDKVIVLSGSKTVTTQDGYLEVDLVETESMGATVFYTFTVAGLRFNKTVPIGSALINVLDLPDFG